jgi:hypothetical protein
MLFHFNFDALPYILVHPLFLPGQNIIIVSLVTPLNYEFKLFQESHFQVYPRLFSNQDFQKFFAFVPL